MSAQDSGGPAFPCTEANYTDPKWTSKGLSMRDYFAAKALSGMLASKDSEDFDSEQLRRNNYTAYCANYAESAYEFADAMLEARKK